MQKLLGAEDADLETPATPLNSKFEGSPTCGSGRFGARGRKSGITGEVIARRFGALERKRSFGQRADINFMR